MTRRSKREMARADRILPGVWRLRLPLPWEATPHGNAWAVSAGDGIVLFDTGYGGPDGLRQLELGLAQAGFDLDDVVLIACTHAHADHYGCAAAIVERIGCPLWLHPAWEHVRGQIEDPEGAWERRIEAGLRDGAPREQLERLRRERGGGPSGFDGAVGPDRELRDGVEVETDLGAWRALETPGHAPSHVVFHQPERRLLISGDLIVGRVFLYFDHGHTPDPVGEFLSSLDVVAGLDSGLCLSGHGRPFRDVPGKVAANRAEVERQLGAVREVLGRGSATAFEILCAMQGTDEPPSAALGYGLEMTRAYLDRLRVIGEAGPRERDDLVEWGLR